MRPVHLLGAGLIIGLTALGAVLAVISFRWADTTYANPPPGAQQPGSAAGTPASQDVAEGKTIFDQKCKSCHTIGGGKLVGPDLKGVSSKRPHDWLINFISAPDQVIASGDPTATQLVKDYGGVPMPNVGVTKPQADQVIAYIDFQTAGSVPSPATGQPTAASTGAAPTSAPPAAAPTAPAAVQPGPTAAAPAPPAGATAAQGKALFDQKCAGCHTIGGGRAAGPDLKGVSSNRSHDWLVNFIVAPDKVIASGDPTASQLVKQYGTPMPNLSITEDQAEQILAYIDAQSGGGGGAAPAASPTALPLGNPAAGRALFIGERSLSNKGPACSACHNAAGAGILGGGSWGLDLTGAQTKFGTTGLLPIMKSPPYPGMAEAFVDHPITDGEASDLAAFFAQIEAEKGGTIGYAFPLFGIGALVVFAGLVQFVWRNRVTGVRQELVRREQGPGNREQEPRVWQ